MKTCLDESLAAVKAGSLPLAAVVRGDKKKLVSMYGPAVATIARGMQALARKRVALKVVELRRASAAAAATEAAAQKAAAGAALKQAAQKERRWVKEQLCGN